MKYHDKRGKIKKRKSDHGGGGRFRERWSPENKHGDFEANIKV